MYKNITQNHEGIGEIQTSSLCPTMVQTWESLVREEPPQGVVPVAGAGSFRALRKAAAVPAAKRGLCASVL